MQPFYWPAAAVCDSPTPDQAAASAAVTHTYNKQEFCADKISEDKIKQIEKESKKLFSRKNVFYVSSFSGSGLEKITQSIGSRLANEKN